MSSTTLAFIGAGNMSRAIIGGLLNQGFSANTLWATDRNADAMQDLASQGMHTTSNNAEAVSHADVVILCVKPQVLKDVCVDLRDAVQARKPLIISVAAGITTQSINEWLGGDVAVVRAMPNTPALVGEGATGLFANADVSDEQKQLASNVASATGLALWVNDEALIDSVTAVSGSGPAYYFLMMEAMIAAGEKLGLTAESAKALTLQTALGAAKMAKESEFDPAELRRRVTSPNGTTEKAIESFLADGLPATVDKALEACADRSKALAAELAK